MTLVFLATLGAAVVAFVLYPVFSQEHEAAPTQDETGKELEALAEKKARILDAIKDLDFEKDAGKVSKEDYESARNGYLAEVAEVMARIDALTAEKPERPDKKSKKKPRKKTPGERPEAERACPSCGETSPATAKFCIECGKPFALTCSSCGEELPEAARFCSICGEKIEK